MTPVLPDRDAIAAATRYVVKGAFAPGRRQGVREIRASQGVGYYSTAAKAARRAYKAKALGPEHLERFAFEPAFGGRGKRTPRNLAVTKEDQTRYAALRATTRRNQYVDTTADGRYGIRRTHDRTTGRQRIDVVRVVPVDGRREHVTIAEGVSEERARALLGQVSQPGRTAAEG